jgi:hypothetical protein
MKLGVAGLSFTLTLLAASVAHAQAPAANPEPAPLTREEWYGWQTLIADGATSLFLLPAAFVDDADPFAWAAVGGYLAGGPIVHVAHANYGRSVLSLALRAGLPVVLGMGGHGASGGGEFGSVGLVAGIGIGIAGAIAIDAALLAYDEVPVESGLPALRLDLRPGHAALSLGGRF